jgi:hypothetical protein
LVGDAGSDWIQKTDFNDVLKNRGKEEIMKTIQNAVPIDSHETRLLKEVIPIETLTQQTEIKENRVHALSQMLQFSGIPQESSLLSIFEKTRQAKSQRIEKIGELFHQQKQEQPNTLGVDLNIIKNNKVDRSRTIDQEREI